MPYLLLVWCLLAVVVLSLAGYRMMIARREDDLVHLGDTDAALINSQNSVATRLGAIDRWGKILTIVCIALGLVLGSIYLYQGWIESAQKIHV